MPGTGSTDAVGRSLKPIAAAVQPPAVPHRLRALLADTDSDENLIAGFLLGYGDRTRAAYLADLRDFHAWCAGIGIGLLAVRRGHIEAYIRALEQAGRSRATVARRLATLAGFYRYAVQEEALPHSPAAHIRRPSVGARFADTWP
jgi:integrase